MLIFFNATSLQLLHLHTRTHTSSPQLMTLGRSTMYMYVFDIPSSPTCHSLLRLPLVAAGERPLDLVALLCLYVTGPLQRDSAHNNN